jgi:hypothetical protein
VGVALSLVALGCLPDSSGYVLGGVDGAGLDGGDVDGGGVDGGGVDVGPVDAPGVDVPGIDAPTVDAPGGEAPTGTGVLDGVSRCEELFDSVFSITEMNDASEMTVNFRSPICVPTFAGGEVQFGPLPPEDRYCAIMSHETYAGDLAACADVRATRAMDTSATNTFGLGLRTNLEGVIANVRLAQGAVDLSELSDSLVTIDRNLFDGWVDGERSLRLLRVRSGEAHYAEVAGAGRTVILRGTTDVAPAGLQIMIEATRLEGVVGVDRVVIGRPNAAVLARLP